MDEVPLVGRGGKTTCLLRSRKNTIIAQFNRWGTGETFPIFSKLWCGRDASFCRGMLCLILTLCIINVVVEL